MSLATILGMYLLLTWPWASNVFSVPAMVVWQSTPSQESQPNNSTPPVSSTQPPADQQKAPEQSATPPPTPAAPTQPCAENSQPGSTGKSECKPAASAGGKAKKHPRVRKTVTPAATAAETPPKTTVVHNGGTEDPVVELSPRRNQQQAAQQSENTKQLLAASDANLKKISGRTLSANQQDTVKQIKSYMDQAKESLTDGDVQRAYNLAVKANLLSAELAGH